MDHENFDFKLTTKLTTNRSIIFNSRPFIITVPIADIITHNSSEFKIKTTLIESFIKKANNYFSSNEFKERCLFRRDDVYNETTATLKFKTVDINGFVKLNLMIDNVLINNNFDKLSVDSNPKNFNYVSHLFTNKKFNTVDLIVRYEKVFRNHHNYMTCMIIDSINFNSKNTNFLSRLDEIKDKHKSFVDSHKFNNTLSEVITV